MTTRARHVLLTRACERCCEASANSPSFPHCFVPLLVSQLCTVSPPRVSRLNISPLFTCPAPDALVSLMPFRLLFAALAISKLGPYRTAQYCTVPHSASCTTRAFALHPTPHTLSLLASTLLCPRLTNTFTLLRFACLSNNCSNVVPCTGTA